mgnify:FL=1
MDLKIEKKIGHDGSEGFECNFEIGKKKFFASLCMVPDGFSECMIFYRGQWDDLYCSRCIPVSAEQLEDCIMEFIEDYQG